MARKGRFFGLREWEIHSDLKKTHTNQVWERDNDSRGRIQKNLKMRGQYLQIHMLKEENFTDPQAQLYLTVIAIEKEKPKHCECVYSLWKTK